MSGLWQWRLAALCVGALGCAVAAPGIWLGGWWLLGLIPGAALGALACLMWALEVISADNDDVDGGRR